MEIKRDVEVTLYDGSDKKIGTQFDNFQVEPISFEYPKTSDSTLHIMSFRGEFANKIIKNIISINSSSVFANIEEIFRANT